MVPPMSNEKQIADWNGKSGQRWLTHQARLDAMLADYGAAVLAAAGAAPGETVLDIGCGSGESALDLARAVGPQGHVTGIDISEPLIARARERAAEAGLGIAFEVVDASRRAFAPGGADLLFSRFGLMFFDDPAAAFAHLRGALRAGGRLAFIVWGAIADNRWALVPLEAARGLVPVPPLERLAAAGPFSLSDPARVEALLTGAGFCDVAVRRQQGALLFGIGADAETAGADALDQAMHLGPLRALLARQEPDARAAVCDAVRAAFAAQAGPAGVLLPGSAWVVTARA